MLKFTLEEKIALCQACLLAEIMKDCPHCAFFDGKEMQEYPPDFGVDDTIYTLDGKIYQHAT